MSRAERHPLNDVLSQFKGLKPDAIAAMIHRRKIRGRTGTTSRCPMALLLRGASTGDYVIGRKYIARRSGDFIEKARTPENIAAFVRRFDRGDYPNLIAPAPRCLAPRTTKYSGPSGKHKARRKRGKIVNHLAKLVDRFGQGQ